MNIETGFQLSDLLRQDHPTAAAEDLILTAATEGLVCPPDLIRQRVVPVLRTRQKVAVQVVVSATANQDVSAQVAPQPVTASAQ